MKKYEYMTVDLSAEPSFNVHIKLDVQVGENVMITSGPLESFIGVVDEINAEKQKVKVTVSMFGRDTSVELDFVQVKRI